VCCHLKTAHIAIAVIYTPNNIFIVNLIKIKNKKELKKQRKSMWLNISK
jgi:hypothetical protein